LCRRIDLWDIDKPVLLYTNIEICQEKNGYNSYVVRGNGVFSGDSRTYPRPKWRSRALRRMKLAYCGKMPYNY
jgi:hypothetical protein